ncbi:MAG TPA: 23S rRNA (pseudouridine(1915)-N(3))-methyltransferase RlmH, partial [Candidatus Sulfotelmatobacter sp.]|nr:23S rRNA (pseudouridine(1915)-N(3))-methyltransferase RlmH [Candidatus Sulfotelmatobacter sp.]
GKTSSSVLRWCWPRDVNEIHRTVKIKIAWIGKTKEPAIQSLTDEYLKRISQYAHVDGQALRDEAALLLMFGRGSAGKANKTASSAKSALALMDSHGKKFSSEEFARFLGQYQDRNPLPLVFAVGPANGFTEAAHSVAQHTISLSTMTLPHELARVVLLEQIYRAFTILKGHPYHSGH